MLHSRGKTIIKLLINLSSKHKHSLHTNIRRQILKHLFKKLKCTLEWSTWIHLENSYLSTVLVLAYFKYNELQCFDSLSTEKCSPVHSIEMQTYNRWFFRTKHCIKKKLPECVLGWILHQIYTYLHLLVTSNHMKGTN